MPTFLAQTMARCPQRKAELRRSESATESDSLAVRAGFHYTSGVRTAKTQNAYSHSCPILIPHFPPSKRNMRWRGSLAYGGQLPISALATGLQEENCVKLQ
ncbi:hypothetical protein SKAU_G00012950 [Synaphobranchus kaupii]|uniref:Uncharacterized protein n=1 Tax=Synaphobranchus kaupii TaxID=118154 RepID=A0A9Q1JDI3_SYNKA|nr:hypothetical protein SKAU_G00012950 [Synaphobranchus kaupii]